MSIFLTTGQLPYLHLLLEAAPDNPMDYLER
jgi:hypothetical protein